ncbi:universal stress protein [Nocardioides plantarum]|uniref:Universal stress protein n=1 Tax=Nocardioides plantarum TaxID=29299 RepID=A0ABV5K9Z1_9ACTN|nr:universal stress protein [Nocardioides plantarum]
MEPHLVVAVDGTCRSAGAIRYGVREAGVRGLSLHVLHVSPGALPVSPVLPFVRVDVEATGQEIVAAAAGIARALDPDLEVVEELVVGARIAEIVLRTAHADLVVLGRETRHGLDRILTGATVASVASRVRCPLSVVPSEWTSSRSLGRVVVGVESIDDAPPLLGVALDEARRRDASVSVLHAWGLPDAYREVFTGQLHDVAWTAEAARSLEALVKSARKTHPDVLVEVRVVHDQPARALVRASTEADVVLVLRHVPRRVPGPHLGSTARAVLGSAASVVEVVPAPT